MIKKIINHVNHLRDRLAGKIPKGKTRSPHWHIIREQYLKDHPACEVCGRKEKLQVHHKKPFHLHPELELDLNNLITLCEHGTNCHLNYGHLGSFQSFNPDVEEDSQIWHSKFASRPKHEE